MRAKGTTYDTGFVRAGEISRERFDPEVVKRELARVLGRRIAHLTSATVWPGSFLWFTGLRVRCSQSLKLRTRPGPRLGWCLRVCGR
jgi:hypothetical protein